MSSRPYPVKESINKFYDCNQQHKMHTVFFPPKFKYVFLRSITSYIMCTPELDRLRVITLSSFPPCSLQLSEAETELWQLQDGKMIKAGGDRSQSRHLHFVRVQAAKLLWCCYICLDYSSPSFFFLWSKGSWVLRSVINAVLKLSR